MILAIGIGGFKALRATRPDQPPVKIDERVWRVAAVEVSPQRRAPELLLYGRVEAPDLLKVAAANSARVAELAVRDGDRVQQGELLIRLDQRDFLPRLAQGRAAEAELRAQIDSERNRYSSDQAALENERVLMALAEDGVERQKRLKTQRAGSESSLDEA